MADIKCKYCGNTNDIALYIEIKNVNKKDFRILKCPSCGQILEDDYRNEEKNQEITLRYEIVTYGKYCGHGCRYYDTNMTMGNMYNRCLLFGKSLDGEFKGVIRCMQCLEATKDNG